MTALLEPNSSTQPDPSPSPTDWRTHLTPELKADPVVASWAEKSDYKDVPSIIKGMAHAQNKLGSAINLPGKDAKPEELTALKAKLIESGILPKPITDPKEYAIAKPENLPAGMQWSDELTGKLAATMQKYQVPKEMVPELMALHMEALGGASKALTFDLEKGITELRSKYGDKFDERVEMVDRIGKSIFSPESMQFFEQTGINKDPRFLSALLHIAPAFIQDSSFLESTGSTNAGAAAASAKQELQQIMTNDQHPKYKGYWSGDKTVLEYIGKLYAEAHSETPASQPSLSSIRA
jgi:hypothetical protein